MPFGLQGALVTFQRMMDHLIRGLEGFTAAYLDDLVIYSSTWEEHLQHLQKVFSCLKEAGLTAKPKKCQFAMKECKYLGHIVGNDVVRPEVGKLDVVKSFAIPKIKTEVQAFPGLIGYYRRFIPDYATVALPLTDLTRKAAPNMVNWSEKLWTSIQQAEGVTVLCTNSAKSRFFQAICASNRCFGPRYWSCA